MSKSPFVSRAKRSFREVWSVQNTSPSDTEHTIHLPCLVLRLGQGQGGLSALRSARRRGLRRVACVMPRVGRWPLGGGSAQLGTPGLWVALGLLQAANMSPTPCGPWCHRRASAHANATLRFRSVDSPRLLAACVATHQLSPRAASARAARDTGRRARARPTGVVLQLVQSLEDAARLS